MTSELAPYNVVGAYADMGHARKAIDALEFAGLETGKISLLGEGADLAERATSKRKNTTRSDAPMVQRIILRAVGFGLVGAAVGAVLGLILAAAGVSFGTAINSAGPLAATWALFGAIFGTLWGAYSGISQGEAWEATFAADGTSADGNILVAVHSTDQHDIERAEKILREKNAITVGQFDREGHPTTAA